MQMDIEEKSKFYKALGEPIRLRIIEYLLKKEKCTCICNLAKFLKRDQSVIFRHIQMLKDAGIILAKKDANFLICCVQDKKRIKKYLED